MELRLSDLREGESGMIVALLMGPGRQGWREREERGCGFRKRLEDLGLTPGTKVTVVGSAPMRGPLEICVRGSKLAIGRGMAHRILIEATR